jgi:mannose-6-phosphate isomerase
MPVTRLTTKRVEKPWGRRELGPAFASVPAGSAPIGEIWFEVPGGPGGSKVVPELLIKYLFTSDRLSVQVHPDDVGARERGHPRGKDEAWVILDADAEASIALGPRDPTTKEALRAAALDGSIERLLDWKPVRKDDSFYTPAGTIHAIGPGLTLIEIQQNVDLTYRLYDYGSERELHLDEGITASTPVPYVAARGPRELAAGRTLLFDGPKFVIERWRKSGRGRIESDGRPVWLIPLTGSGLIDGGAFEAGGVWLIEGAASLRLAAPAEMLVAYPEMGVIERLWTDAE